MSTFNAPDDVANGVLVRAEHINNLAAATEEGFDLLPADTELKQNRAHVGVDTGAADAYVVTMTYTPSAYTNLLSVKFIPTHTNTGASTINVNGLGVKSVRDPNGSALAAGLIIVGVPLEVCYSTTTGYFHLMGALSPQGPAGPAGGVTSVNVSGGSTGLTYSGGPITTSGTVTMAGTLGAGFGGTGVANNAASTQTITGAYSITWTLTGATALTLPTSGTVATLAGSETFSNKTLTDPNLNNSKLRNIKSANYNAPINTGATSGTINIDWTAGAIYLQNEPTGNIVYTFTNPAESNVWVMLLIASDGTSTGRNFTFPASVTFYGTTFTATSNNKKAMWRAFWDGTEYHSGGLGQA